MSKSFQSDRTLRLKAQMDLLASIRTFFTEKKFIDVMTPPMVKNPGMETHIHPFQVGTLRARLFLLGTCTPLLNFT